MILIAFISGLFLIVVGADWFTDSAVWMAKRSRIPQVVIGATVVSLATTLPELSVSVYAAYSGHVQIAIGNAVGSALANIGLILGISTMIKCQTVERRLFLSNGGFLLFGALVLTGFAWNEALTRVEAVIMLFLLGLFILMSVQAAQQSRSRLRAVAEVAASTSLEQSATIPLIKFAVGAAMITVGGRLLVSSGLGITEWLGIDPLIVGLTFMALGTSLPELVTAIAALIKGHQDLSVGNLIGASFLNLTMVTGAAALVRPLPITRNNLHFDFPVMILLFVILLAFGLGRRSLQRWQGAILFGLYALYITTLLVAFA